MRRRSWVAAAVGVLLVGASVTAVVLSRASGPQPLRVYQGGGVSMSFPGRGAGSVDSIMLNKLCLDHGPTADLTSLTAHDSTGGVEVSGFDVLTRTDADEPYGELPRPIERMTSWDLTGRRTTLPCSEGVRSDFLVVELTKSVPGPATVTSYDLGYRVGGRDYHQVVQAHVTICGGVGKSCTPP